MSAERLMVRVRLLDPGMPVPRYAHPGDAGADLAIAQDIDIPPGQRVLVGTGIAVEIPEGWVCLVHPRSGLAARHGLTMVNAPGTIDAGYRGEVKVNLLNTDTSETIRLHRGDAVGQLVFQRVGWASFEAVDELAPSVRGDRGHGSSGGVAAWTSVGADLSAPSQE
ncbi:MAG: dUTP diphosphatase [Propionibacteriaceae bacterium]